MTNKQILGWILIIIGGLTTAGLVIKYVPNRNIQFVIFFIALISGGYLVHSSKMLSPMLNSLLGRHRKEK
jgi:hypothetical protein